MLSYEDALFYKLLLETGFSKEVNEWIDKIIIDNNQLDGIYLDLACCFGNLNKTISCLHNYILKCKHNEIDYKTVCDKLRLFIKDKVDNDEISLKDAANYLHAFAGFNNYMDEYWKDFFYLGGYYDLYIEELMGEAEFVSIVRQFIDTGNSVDTKDFWIKREEKNKANKKIERKYKTIWACCLFGLSLIVFLLSFLFMKLEFNLNGKLSDKTMGVHIAVICLILVPVFVITALNWDGIYSMLNRSNKEQRKKIKEEKQNIENKNKTDSNNLRYKYELSDNILTRYEYNKLESNKFLSKRKWILFGICELLTLIMTIGSVFYFDMVDVALGVTLIFLGLSFGIYGFCILLDCPIKGIIYSLTPILCYAIPLIITYYGFKVRTDWIIALTTMVPGTILFVCFVMVVYSPIRKYNKAYEKHISQIDESNRIQFSYKINKYNTFYKKDGTNVFIFEYNDDYSIITLNGKFKYNKLKLKDITIEYIEENDTYENCVKKAINILENYN